MQRVARQRHEDHRGDKDIKGECHPGERMRAGVFARVTDRIQRGRHSADGNDPDEKGTETVSAESRTADR